MNDKIKILKTIIKNNGCFGIELNCAKCPLCSDDGRCTGWNDIRIAAKILLDKLNKVKALQEILKSI